MVSVQLLGGFGIRAGDTEVLLAPRVRLLAAYLAWKHDSWVRRDALRGLLWAECDEARASQSLRTALHELKRGLGSIDAAHLLEAGRESVRIVGDEGCNVDAHAYELRVREGLAMQGAASTAPLLAAEALYGGPFLVGCEAVVRGDGDWLLAERARLESLRATALRSIVGRLASSGLELVALEYATKWRDSDPLDEEACRTLVALYNALGQTAHAAAELSRCREALQRELGVEASPETLNLGRSLGLAGVAVGRDAASPGESEALAGSTLAFSPDPRRNAHLVLFHSEQALLAGRPHDALVAIDSAIRTLRKLGDTDGRARACAIRARALLAMPEGLGAAAAARDVETAIAHYRARGSPTDLCAALRLASEIYRETSRFDEAVAVAEEGLELARQRDARDTEARLALSLALACLEDYRLDQAESALAIVLRDIDRLHRPLELLRAVFCRAALASAKGRIGTSERYLREAAATADAMPASPKVCRMRDTIRQALMIVLHAQGRDQAVRDLSAQGRSTGCGPAERCVDTLVTSQQRMEIAIRELEAILRANLPSARPRHADACIHLMTEKMLEARLDTDALRWTAVAVRRGRAHGGTAAESYALCQRAAVLARLGLSERSRVCQRRAAALEVDGGGCWQRAWTAYARGLVASCDGERLEASEWLADAEARFAKMGARRLARMVHDDLVMAGPA